MFRISKIVTFQDVDRVVRYKAVEVEHLGYRCGEGE